MNWKTVAKVVQRTANFENFWCKSSVKLIVLIELNLKKNDKGLASNLSDKLVNYIN